MTDLVAALELIGLSVALTGAYAIVTFFLGAIISRDDPDEGFVASWFIAVVALVAVTVILLNTKGFATVTGVKTETEVVNEWQQIWNRRANKRGM